MLEIKWKFEKGDIAGAIAMILGLGLLAAGVAAAWTGVAWYWVHQF